MKVRQDLLAIFNTYRVVPNESSLEIAKHFKFKWSKSEGIWVAEKRQVMGENMSALFQKFIKIYNKHYRMDVAAKEFYQLSDDDIESMFEELPYYVSSYHGREKYKPNAASFLRERIWMQDYPGKPKRERVTKVNLSDIRNWDDYILFIPDHNKDMVAAYRELMSFEVFKHLISGE